MAKEAEKQHLIFKNTLPTATHATAEQHDEYRGKYRLLGKLVREIPPLTEIKTWVHASVRARYNSGYQSEPIERFAVRNGEWPPIWPE